MEYRIEIVDGAGRRVAVYDDVPLIEATRNLPDEPDTVRGLLPRDIAALGPGDTVRVWVGGARFCEGRVHWTGPQWSDARKLILDRYIPFHEIVAFEAASDPGAHNRRVAAAFTQRTAQAMVRELVNRARGPIHYGVAHGAYPDGAVREFTKFAARATPENALEIGGIAVGQWVGPDRIDATAAFAKDGDTIAGLVVDGVPWPDLRLMLIDAEETSRNAHAIKRHPEVAGWSDGRYAASGYRLRADAATAALQELIDTRGIGHIELNPHRDAQGNFDDRIDAYGRYLGLVHGDGQCFNAALVELGLADVYLHEEGRYHDPALALKDFFSYAAPQADTIAAVDATLAEFDVSAGLLEAVAAIAYAADGGVFAVDPDHCLHFRRADRVDRVVFFDPLRMGARFGEASGGLVNLLRVTGNPVTATLDEGYARGESIDAHGPRGTLLEYFSLTRTDDAARLAAGLFDDLAYPAPSGEITFFHGDAALRVGQILELRGAPARLLGPRLPGAWGGRFGEGLVGRVARVRHRFTGRRVESTALLTSPLRSVGNPLAYLVRSQPPANTLFEFRLDDTTVGLDLGFHLD
jgi:endonuclease YncB( thermonuclease family)